MRVIFFIAKLIVKAFCSFIKSNKNVKEYAFSVVLKEDLDNYIDTRYFAEYEHIKRSINVLKMFKNKNDFVIFDIGGSNGKTSILYSNAFPDNKVYVFEPIKESFHKLTEKIKERKNIIAINKAVGNENEKRKINLSKRISSSSLLDLYADKQSTLFAEALEKAGTEEVEICKLDDFFPEIQQIGIMKIDVQGFELEVLKGGCHILERTCVVLTEVNNHDGYRGSPKYNEIDQALRDSSFILFDICPSTRENNQLKEWDVIYVNKRFYEDRNN